MSDIPGPYMNEDGDWWVAVADAPYLEARRYVKQHVDLTDDYKLVYEGRETVWLCATEGCETTVKEEHDPACRQVPAWHFREVER